MAVFEETIQSLSGGTFEPPEWVLQATVMTHEFGHILGLVNNGTPMLTDHQDEANGKHCDVQDCLMNWAAETNNIVGALFNTGQPAELDSQCINDLQANGGK